jgi:ubiquinone/menaquinone biosynthesis C-methylase UbiE
LPDFSARAARYDELRPQDASWWELYELLLREGDLRGRRVLDVGCGTGRFVSELARVAKVWGVDASPGMLEVAKSRVPRSVRLKEARAEQLPFRDAWFERVTYWLVIHLLDRPAAFREARRVLAPKGRVCIVSFDELHFTNYWANRWFPRIQEFDRATFPTAAELELELAEAGFASVRLLRIDRHERIDRETALVKLRGKHVSTYDRLDPEEYEAGLRRAEEELPAELATSVHWLVAFATV